MVVGMQKKVLSEIGLYYGDVAMPKGFEIDREQLQSDILSSNINNKDLPFSKNWDMLNTYLREHIKVEYDFTLVNKKHGEMFINHKKFPFLYLTLIP